MKSHPPLKRSFGGGGPCAAWWRGRKRGRISPQGLRPEFVDALRAAAPTTAFGGPPPPRAGEDGKGQTQKNSLMSLTRLSWKRTASGRSPVGCDCQRPCPRQSTPAGIPGAKIGFRSPGVPAWRASRGDLDHNDAVIPNSIGTPISARASPESVAASGGACPDGGRFPRRCGRTVHRPAGCAPSVRGRRSWGFRAGRGRRRWRAGP